MAATAGAVAAGSLALWLAIGRPPTPTETTTDGTSVPGSAGPTVEKTPVRPSNPPADTTTDPPREPVSDGGSKDRPVPSVTPEAGRRQPRDGVPKQEPPRSQSGPGGAAAATVDGSAPPAQPALPQPTPSNTSSPPAGNATDVPKGEPPPTSPPAVATPPVAPPSGPSDEDQIVTALNRWARAYAARDARGVDEVQPGSERSLQKQFDALKSLQASLSGCRVSIQQSTATAACSEAYAWEMKIGGGRKAGTRQRTFSLDKSSGTWRITGTRSVD